MMRDTTHSDDRPGDNSDGGLIAAAEALSEAIRTTLGPRGMDKMLISDSGTVVVTNDGASILDRISIDDPVGRLLERVAQAQTDQMGDGATTAVVLAGALLTEAASLREYGLHPTTIVDGYARAGEHAEERLQAYETHITGGTDARLRHVAETVVTNRWDNEATAQFATLTLDALRRVDFDTSQLTLKSYAGGELQESEVIDGTLIDTETSSTTTNTIKTSGVQIGRNPTIGMVAGEVGTEEPDSVESVRLETAEQAQAFRAHEQADRKVAADRAIEAGVDVLLCQKSIDEQIQDRLFAHRILPVERTRQDEFDVVAEATGAVPVQSITQLTPSDTGQASIVERRSIGSTPTLAIRGSDDASPRVSLLLRGGTPHVADEVRRIVADCIDVTRLAADYNGVVPGGGATAMELAQNVSTFATSVSNREQLVVEAVAEALEVIPRTLAINAGQDPVETLTTLRQRHAAGDSADGIGPDGCVQNMYDSGVVEPTPVFGTALGRAIEAATLILRVDDVITVSGSDESDHEVHSKTDAGQPVADTGGYPWAIGH